jgi:protein-S-isoprenylcysteine O-methyltransferase Ste14
MSADRYSDAVIKSAQKPRSVRFKVVSMLVGGLVFVFVVPGILFFSSYALEKYVLAPNVPYVKTALSAALIIIGLSVWAWAILIQISSGKGTPMPIAPPQELVVSGPYRYCRNPIQLGAMLYYWGLGTHFGSMTVGFLMFCLTLLIGSFYNKVFEEKELLQRFGKDYEAYRAVTPFLIPKWKRHMGSEG